MPDADTLRNLVADRPLTIEDLGPEGDRVELVASLVDGDLLSPVTSLLVDWFAGEDRLPPADEADLCGALVEAVTGSASPAVFGDTIDQLCGSTAVLVHHGRELAAQLVTQAGPPGDQMNLRSALRSAQALEAATRLEIATPTPARWDLFSLLSKTEPGTPAPYQRACIRSVVSIVETSTDADALIEAVRRLAGLDPFDTAAGAVDVEVDPAVESDAAVALARTSILLALRSADDAGVVARLDDALRYLASVIETDDRVDARITAAIGTVLRSLVTGGPVSSDTIDDLAAAVREHLHYAGDDRHWITDRIVASNVAWARLAVDLRAADTELGKDSWYEAVIVLDGLIDLYRTSRSKTLFVRGEDGETVRGIVAPLIEGGFAAKVSLLRHLDDHISYLKGLVDDGKASEDQAADLDVAIGLRDEARAASGPLPKPGAGATPLSGDGGSPADSDTAASSRDRVLANTYTRQLISRISTGNATADELLNRIVDGFSASSDYADDLVREATNLVSHFVVTFLISRNRMGESQRPYLFKARVDEKELAADLDDFLIGTGALGDIRTEVRGIDAGRADIEFAFPGFNLYVELKVDSTRKPLGDKVAYLKQTAAYQSEGKRIGFLIALKLLKKNVLPPVVRDRVEMVQVPDGTSEGRHIAAVTIAGNRTKPSDYRA